MDGLRGDQLMLEPTEFSANHEVPIPGQSTPPYNNSPIVPFAQSGKVILNGSHNITQSPSPRSRDETLDLSLLQTRYKSEDPSGLVQQVHSILNIDSPMNGTSASETVSSTDSEEAKPKVHQLQVAMLPTGLCYDVRMRFHCELQPHQRPDDHHPEDPRRIFAIYQALCHAGLVDDPMSTRPLVPQPLVKIAIRNAEPDEICQVHDARHYAFMDSLKDTPEADLLAMEKRFDSIYLNRLTNLSALLSAGGAIETCRAVTSRQIKNGIAVIRPPGHHAEPEGPMGFCFFDNVAVAAKTCQVDFPETCRKILIVDWDVHHGNGIQKAFEWDPNVLYISIHVFRDENGLFYPGSDYGDHLHVGLGNGKGYNINIPWPSKGMGDADYLYAFQKIVMPVAFEFNPDLVVVAAGFDAAQGDMLGGCFVSPAGYAHMTHMLMSLAEGRLAVCLEGGYNLEAISKSALAVTRVLMGEPPDRLDETRPTEIGLETVNMVAMYHSRYWRSLEPKDLTKGNLGSTLASSQRYTDTWAETTNGGQRLHDVIRYYQAAKMLDKHKMFPLHVFKDGLSESFENQLLATHNYAQKVPLIVFLHGPPDLIGTPDPNTHQMELHNTWLADGLKYYIDWAATKGYAVMDLNVPKYLTGIDEDDGFFYADRDDMLGSANKLMIYLWENYLDINESTEIFFVGVGEPYGALLHLIDTRTSAYPRISGIVNFVNDSRLSIVSDANTYWLTKWYRQNSMVFVSEDNPIYRPDGPKKISRRYGNVIKSYGRGLHGMLMAHKEEVKDFIEGRIKGKAAVIDQSGNQNRV